MPGVGEIPIYILSSFFIIGGELQILRIQEAIMQLVHADKDIGSNLSLAPRQYPREVSCLLMPERAVAIDGGYIWHRPKR
jgi:hypothetical protein